MSQRYLVLSLNPSSAHAWDRASLHDPLSNFPPDLTGLIAEAIGEQSGKFLVSVNLDVQIVSQIDTPAAPALALEG